MNMSVHTPKINPDPGRMVSRRLALGVVGGGLAAFFSGAVPVGAATHDPIPGWFAEWRRLRAEWIENGHDEKGDESAYGEQLWAQTNALEIKISTTKATTTEGARAQLEWMLADSCDMDFQCGHREALELALDAMKGGLF